MKFDDLTTYAYDLRQKHALRDSQAAEMEKMYKLDWEETTELKNRFAHMSITLSPEARNKTKAMVRLMTATHPKVSAPEEHNQGVNPEILTRVEQWANLVLRQSSRIKDTPVENDVCLSAVLYDEFFITVNSTASLLAMEGSKARKARNKDIYKRTPYILSVHSPMGCYADYDGLGLVSFAMVKEMTPSEIANKFGQSAMAKIGMSVQEGSTNIKDKVKIWQLWTLDEYCCWSEGAQEPIEKYDHNLPVLPVVHVIVEGSRDLFEEPENQREPFLLTLYKSGLWFRSNMYLSSMSTNAKVGLHPQLAFTSPSRSSPDIDMSAPFSMFHLEPGENIATWNKNLIDPGIASLYEQTKMLSDASTLYDQVAGAPVGPGAAYSTTALLNQAGRLPLTATQVKTGWGIGRALWIAAMLYKDEGSWPDASYVNILSPDEVPENLELEAVLDLALPQDRLGMANVFKILKGEMPKTWLIEHVLGENNPDDLVRKTYDEIALDSQVQMFLQQQQAQATMQLQMQQQMQQAMMQQQLAQGAGPQEPPPQSMVGAPPPEQMPIPTTIPETYEEANAGPGLEGGLPAEMAKYGGQGPEQGVIEPDEGQVFA